MQDLFIQTFSIIYHPLKVENLSWLVFVVFWVFAMFQIRMVSGELVTDALVSLEIRHE